MRNFMNKRILAVILAAAMGGSLCADITVCASEAEEPEVVVSEEENQVLEEDDTTVDTGELEELTEVSVNENQEEEQTNDSEEKAENNVLGHDQIENTQNEVEEQPLAPQSNEIALLDTENKCGDNLTWSFNETTGVLTINGKGAMYNYGGFDGDDEFWDSETGQWVERRVPWEGQRKKIIGVVLEKGVTTVGGSAFGGCTSLKSINFPNSLTRINDFAFGGCTSLKSLKLPAGITHIGIEAFGRCKALTSVSLPDSVTEVEGFYGCSSLTSINIPASVKTIGGWAFCDCTALKNITFSGSVENIGERAFQGCTSLESINIPAGTKEIGPMAFMQCDKLKSITLPNSVEKISFAAFAYDNALKEITLPKKLSEIEEYAFFGCDKLSELTIPKGVSSVGRYIYGYYGEELENENRIEGKDVKKYSNVKIKCYTNTAGHKYAKDYGVSYELLDGKKAVTKVTLSGISKKIAAGKKIKLTAKVSPSNATNKAVTWKSSNKKVATVTSKGAVTINKKAAGKSVTITATAKDGSKKKATYKITVMKGVVQKVAISGNKSVKAGKTLKLKAKVTASKKANTKLKWTTSNKKYATVSSSGKVKTYKAGKGKKVKITAEATDGSGKKKTVTVKIK